MLVAATLCFCLAIGAATAQSENLEIYSLHVRSDIQLRFATTLITSRVANKVNSSNEAVFSVTLPNEAFISNFTMEIDGVIYPGLVESKAAAQKKFEKAKKKGKSTGLVSNWPPESNNFRVQVNVAALSKVTFNLTYQELLRRTLGVYQHKIFIDPGQPVDDLQVHVAIQESRDITTLHVPPIQTASHVNAISTEVNPYATILRPNTKTAFISYRPTPEQQKSESGDAGISGHFVVEYEIERSLDAGDLLVVNGYFVHFLAPAVSEPIPNDVLFILDMSGSMQGKKLKQLKQAMLEILEELGEGDRFNIIEFTGNTKLYKDTMVEVSSKSIREAMSYVNGLRATGWTDINEALLEGVDLFRRAGSKGNSPLLLFLTDGLPSDGETNQKKILENVFGANEGGVPIFSLAFGQDADWNLVKTVAVQNDGFGRKIYEGSDAALQITGFYDEVAVTLVNDVNVKYLGDAVTNGSVTQSSFKNFFNGSEMVIAGKLEDPDTRTLDIEVLGNTVEGSLVLSEEAGSNAFDLGDVTGLMEISDLGEITEKLWAYLTIKQLMDGTVKTLNSTERAEMKKKALELSLKYGFVTPLTSMVVTRPQDLEGDDDDDLTTTPAPTTPKPTTTKPRYYGGGGGGGGYGGGGGGDPHYMIRIRGIQHPLCFDVRSEVGEIHNLVTDPVNDITVNTIIVGSGSLGINGQEKTFIGQVSIQLKHHVIIISPDAVFFDTKVFTWDREFIKHFGGSKFSFINDGRGLSVQFKVGPELLIKRHIRTEKETVKTDFLNVYVNDEDYFSKHTYGLIGQFVNGHKHIIMKKEHIQPGGKLMGKFQIKERSQPSSQVPSPKAMRHVIRGNLVNRSDVISKGKELCWMVHKKYEDFFLGERTNFLVDEFIKLKE